MADKSLSFREKLMHIQHELKAPKNQHNSFGNYNYRNAESILEALKPLLVKYGATVTITDMIVQVGERTYVNSIATIYDNDSDAKLSVEAYAREAETKKGMDDAQVTGATSSYARKYALNGLFLLDDTEDVDTEAYQTQTQPEKAQAKKATTKKKEEPKTQEVSPLTEEELLFLNQRYTGENLNKLLDYFHIEDISQIEPAAGRALIKKIQEQKKKKAEG